MDETKMHYCVLYTSTEKQRMLAEVLSQRFPSSRGRVFLAEREFWIRKTKEVGRKIMFPGYIFVKTDMPRNELHIFAKEHGVDIDTFVKELSLRGGVLSGDSGNEPVVELSQAEAEFMDKMFDEDGVERMSVGYYDGKGCVVVEGPLKGWEHLITKVDRHNRTAMLKITFREQKVVVGLEIRPKSMFVLDEDTDHGVLSDGTQIDLSELSKSMMDNTKKDMAETPSEE